MYHYHTGALHWMTKASQRRLAILDRSWPSELVYAGVYRGGTPWPMMGRMLDRVILKHAGIYIFCLADPSTIKARHLKLSKERPELYSADKVDQVAAQFNQLYLQLSHRPDVMQYRLDVEGRDMDGFCHRVLTQLDSWQRRQYQPALSAAEPNVLGHLASADYLFVGDSLKPKLKRIEWPFYEHGNCSLFLAQQLEQITFDESRGMWTNANSGNWHVDALMELKPSLQLIALGNNSAERLAGHQFAKIDHPQHARRFPTKTCYADQLRNAIT